MQVKVGNTETPFKITTAGRIVGWQITLSSPTAAQTKYFDANEGGTVTGGDRVIHQVKGLDYRLEYESPLIHLQPYFGQTADFRADELDAGQAGRRDRPDRPDVGAGARAAAPGARRPGARAATRRSARASASRPRRRHPAPCASTTASTEQRWSTTARSRSRRPERAAVRGRRFRTARAGGADTPDHLG